MARISNRKGHWIIALTLVVAIALLAVIWLCPRPLLIWNASKSVPIGWYWVEYRSPKLHEIAVVKLEGWPSLYADIRGYLPEKIWLLKPVVAEFQGVVCRFGRYVFRDGKLVAKARIFDSSHRLLPHWKECRVLKPDEIFLIARPRDSFDSRYFGPVNLNQVAGVAHWLHFPFE